MTAVHHLEREARRLEADDLRELFGPRLPAIPSPQRELERLPWLAVKTLPGTPGSCHAGLRAPRYATGADRANDLADFRCPTCRMLLDGPEI